MSASEFEPWLYVLCTADDLRAVGIDTATPVQYIAAEGIMNFEDDTQLATEWVVNTWGEKLEALQARCGVAPQCLSWDSFEDLAGEPLRLTAAARQMLVDPTRQSLLLRPHIGQRM